MSSVEWYSDTTGTAAATATVFDKRYARFIFNNKDVSALYIDWGDGEGRTVDTANYQWSTFPTTVQDTYISHTYTATGTYNIITKAITQKGIVSKYYCSSSTAVSGNVSPFEISERIQPIVVSDGTATAIIKCENRTVKSGIDNSIFVSEGPKQVYAQIPPILNATEYGYLPSKIKLGITAVLVDSIRDSTSNEAVVAGGSRRVKKFYVELDTSDAGDGTTVAPINLLDSAVDISGTAAAIDGAAITQILKVEYRNPKVSSTYLTDYTRNEVFNRIKIFLTTKGIDGYYYSVTYVTAGSPIKSVDDLYRYITMDFSQSRAKASNVDNSKYRFDNGKIFFKPAGDFQWAITGTNYFDNNTRQTQEVRRVGYTYMPRPIGLRGSATYSSTGTQALGNGKWVENTTSTTASTRYVVDQFALDDFGRFYDQYHLIRNSMQPSSSTDATGTTVSSLVDNKPYVFRITPPVNWTGATDDRQSATKIDAPGMDTTDKNYTADYTSKAFNNGSSNEISFTEMNGATFQDIANASRTANEYFLLLFPKKTNEIFFNMTNYANQLMSDWANVSGVKISGLYYLGVNKSGTINQSAQWEALEFEDTTSISKTYAVTGGSDTLSGSYLTKEVSFAKSGYISFDTPSDWQSISLDNLCGGYYNSTNTTTTGSLGIKITGGTVSGNVDDATYGKYLVVTGATISDQMEAHFNSANEVGAFNYIAFCSGATDMPLWVAKGAANGWDGADTLYFHYGENHADYNVEGLSGAKTWVIRRVNIYDVIDGPSKVYKGSSVTDLPPVDAGNADGAVVWNGTYMIATTGSGVGSALETAWEGTDLYALKVVVSGTGGGATVPKPEMWNVFDATEGHTAVVKEIDDSAYNLNSLAITSSISMSRAGNYYTAISRKGKVFIVRTGTPLQEIAFSSVALGDTTTPSSAFTTSSVSSSLYGHLHKVRELQSNDVRVYWDEQQKDGTYVRLWGVIKGINESLATGGPRAILSYDFNLIIEEIALLDIDGDLMTDIFPIGGIQDARSYT